MPGCIVLQMLTLAPDWLLPAQAQPAQIGQRLCRKFPCATRRVDVLDANQEFATHFACQVRVQQGRIGVTQVKFSIWTWGKSEDGRYHGMVLRRRGEKVKHAT